MREIEGLLARVEAATGADRALDVWIDAASGAGRKITPTVTAEQVAMLVDIEHGNIRDDMSDADAFGVPHYTASVDAALALVERVFPGALFSSGRGPNHTKRRRKADGVKIPFDGYVANNDRIGERSHCFGIAEGPNEALAILAALLRALSTSKSESGT